MHCPPTVQKLPRRVIDVGNASYGPRIHEAKPNETGSYTCLSYCWGTDQQYATKSDNIKSRKFGFDANVMPATIKDAIVVTRHMGIRYLWVDSLCIIQDSNPDWLWESAQMCSIYSGATVTLAAVDSPDCNMGLCVAGAGRRICSVQFEDLNMYAREHIHSELGRFDSGNKHASTLQKDVLHGRGWALQELVLSPRVLWCMGSELFWNCLCETACECHPEPTTDLMAKKEYKWDWMLRKIPNLDRLPLKQIDWNDMWLELVSQYTRRRLTLITDRLPAIAGLAKQLSSRLGVRYLYGLWETENFVDCLLWHVSKHDTYGAELSYAPSWSWASVTGHINFPKPLGSGGYQGDRELAIRASDCRTRASATGRQQCERSECRCLSKTRIWQLELVEITTGTF
ncbi:HET-domain-containing protein [Byssothecium circinans]|uniref:HET-domain-containing protein n=1 Tax=Byssothecium circinans TaxID=147558 RepID=A0A6A5U9I1_9PLEO|nr:HET-domain-containing protein [Byssothecium circinans]